MQGMEMYFDLAYGFRGTSVYDDWKARWQELDVDTCSHPRKQEAQKEDGNYPY